MRFVTIDVEGLAVDREAPGDPLHVVNAEVGQPGLATVRLRSHELRGHVNDRGHLLDPPLPVNVAGSVVLACLGGPAQPYAGPVVLTGWQDRPWSDQIEIMSLSQEGVRFLLDLARDVGLALAGERVAGYSPAWSEAVRGYRDRVGSSPRPLPLILSGTEALDRLHTVRRGR